MTKRLPFAWTGGNRAVKTMEYICREKGVKVLGSGMAFWAEAKQEASVKACVDTICRLF